MNPMMWLIAVQCSLFVFAFVAARRAEEGLLSITKIQAKKGLDLYMCFHCQDSHESFHDLVLCSRKKRSRLPEQLLPQQINSYTIGLQQEESGAEMVELYPCAICSNLYEADTFASRCAKSHVAYACHSTNSKVLEPVIKSVITNDIGRADIMTEETEAEFIERLKIVNPEDLLFHACSMCGRHCMHQSGHQEKDVTFCNNCSRGCTCVPKPYRCRICDLDYASKAAAKRCERDLYLLPFPVGSVVEAYINGNWFVSVIKKDLMHAQANRHNFSKFYEVMLFGGSRRVAIEDIHFLKESFFSRLTGGIGTRCPLCKSNNTQHVQGDFRISSRPEVPMLQNADHHVCKTCKIKYITQVQGEILKEKLRFAVQKVLSDDQSP